MSSGTCEQRGLPAEAWDSYSRWQWTLVAKKRGKDPIPAPERASAQQRLLAAAAESSAALAATMREAFGGGRLTDVPALREPLTSVEVRHPERGWEQMLHDSLAAPPHGTTAATRAEAAQVLFWVACTERWLESGMFEDPPAKMWTQHPFDALTTADPGSLTGDQRLVLDNATRDVLRGMGGIPHVRSAHNHHLLDCPTTRAWWRVEIAKQAAVNSNGALSLDACCEVFLQKGCWRAWTTTAMTQAGLLSAGPCVAGFVEAVARLRDAQDRWPTQAQARELAARMARRSAGCYPGMLNYRDLATMAA